jgi:transaldolase
VISPPHAWQVRINASDIPVESRIERPVNPLVVEDLQRRFPDFVRAYEEDGVSVGEIGSYGPTLRTLRQFMRACTDLAILARDVITPDPDKA